MQHNVDPGLAQTIAAETQLSDVRGRSGVLIIVGYRVDEIALNSTFEGILFLLWNGRLPML